MAKKNAPEMTSEDILARIREAERRSQENIDKATSEAARIVEDAKKQAEEGSARSQERTRSEIVQMVSDKELRLKTDLGAILREREGVNSALKQRSKSKLPKAKSIILERIAGMLND
jgi:vacuolar-type H+-ATPase subunit H